MRARVYAAMAAMTTTLATIDMLGGGGGERHRCKAETREARKRTLACAAAHTLSPWSKRKPSPETTGDYPTPPSSSSSQQEGECCAIEAMIMDELLLCILGCGVLSLRDLQPVSLVCRYVPVCACAACVPACAHVSVLI
jgi:hypothetical protein